jgi:hypothetical protein
MAYTTGAALNSALLNQLNFRAMNNAPISSLFTLYANGQGQTYWSNSINPMNLSTLSSAIGVVYETVESDLQRAIISTNNATSTLIYETLGDVVGTSTLLSTFMFYTISSFSTTFYNDATNSTNIGNISVDTIDAFLSTSNSLQIQLNSFYLSTLNATNSTIAGISSISSFYADINAVQVSVNLGLSTVSSSTGLQTNTNSNYFVSTINNGLWSTICWTSSQISSIYASQTSIYVLNTFSTQINSSLLSASISLLGQISTTNYTVSTISSRVSTLEYEYLFIQTNSYVTTSTFFSTNITPLFNSTNYQSTVLGNTISSLYGFSTLYNYDISCLVASTNNNIAQISSLSEQFSVITTSSILEGIYATFIELEAYSVNIINSTYTTSIYIVSTVTSTSVGLALSTTNYALSQIVSTVSTTNASVSSLLSTTTANVSSLLSTATGNITEEVQVLSSVVSTTIGNVSTFFSTSINVDTTQVIVLDTNTISSFMDFANYRNINVQIYNIQNASPYRLTFDPMAISGILSKQGLINIDIRTIGQNYTQNGNMLALDINRWGVINNSYEQLFPMIANSDYSIQYQYTILNNNVYGNLTNIYPHTSTSALSISSVNSNLALDPSSSGIFSSGTVLYANWSNYIFSTFSDGTFNEQINIDIVDMTYNTTQTIGGITWPLSSATFTLPSSLYYRTGLGSYYPISFNSYIVGEPNNASVVNALLYVP